MSILKVGLLPAAALASAIAASPAAAADTFRLDPEHSDVVFMVSHFGYSDTIGRFNQVEGTIVMDENHIASSTIELTIDAASLDTNHAERDAHLKSPDFFNVEEFPTITFASTAIAPEGEDRAALTGDLTMHGVTRPVTLAVTLNKLAPHPLPDYDGVLSAGFSARGSLMRSDFGIDLFAPAIGDEVTLLIEVEALRVEDDEES